EGLPLVGSTNENADMVSCGCSI
ncbi:TPA: rhodanese-like domain-containing protein, partial [Yersinia enterocolitica]